MLPVSAQDIPGDSLAPSDSLERDYASELPRFEPLSAEEAVASFQLLEGFRLQLVAAEPLVADPIAFAFDAQARLFVVEMCGYSEQGSEQLGRLALLEDRDGDGVMDHRTTYVEQLSWPTAVWPWKDGALVAEPPNITWYRDTDGDGISDTSEVWFSGFSRSNVQGLVNSLRWGVDGYIHGATSSAGGEIDQIQVADEQTTRLQRIDFAIDPLSKTLSPVSGGGQHGLSFNRWGDKFVTSNSDHLQQIIDLNSWLTENPSQVKFPPLRRSIASDGPQAEVFRTSPVEPWRIVRTRLRVGGLVPGPVEGGGRAAGYFTGATGVWIMDAESSFLDENHDAALVCDVGSNLVHRKKMIDHGLYWSADRVDRNTELLTSSDTWFRPVQLGDGPDGALYIADMYREVIEHPKSLPPIIKKHLDLTSGRDRGRIWRLVPEAFTQTADSKLDLLAEPHDTWVEMLSDPIAWRRRMASQLLIEHADVNLAPLLKAYLQQEDAPQARLAEAQILAMHIAARWQVFDGEWSRLGLSASHPRVVEHATRLTAELGLVGQVGSQLARHADTKHARIQLELAKAGVQLAGSQKSAVLGPLLSTASEPLVCATLGTACVDEWQWFSESRASEIGEEQYARWLRLLLPAWTQRMQKETEIQQWLAEQIGESKGAHLEAWLDAIAELGSQAEIDLVMGLLSDDTLRQIQEYVDIKDWQEDPQFVRKARLLPKQKRLEYVEFGLRVDRSETLQLTSLELLESSLPEQLVEVLVPRLASMTPRLQGRSLQALVKRRETTEALLTALEEQPVMVSQVPLSTRQQIVTSSHKDIATRGEKLFSSAAGDREGVIETYARSFDRPIDAEVIGNGRKLFAKTCAQCHQLGNLGTNVGAPLAQLHEKSPEQLLTAILDPNREVDPRFVGYSVLLDDERTLAGVIRDESANEIVLVEAGGKVHSIQRTRLQRLRNSGKSLMPEGFEQQLDPQQMHALIAFLRHER